jgi:hypothetical protein
MQKDFRRMPREITKVVSDNCIMSEKNWKDKFAVIPSRFNDKLHSSFKEYFDTGNNTRSQTE